MVRSKKQSRRMPARKKFKIARKVREHNRKMKKEAKSKEKSKRLKKDPGIPNLFPFKEQLLKQMEERKQRSEDEKARQKLQRKKKQNERRSLQGLQNDALKRTREFEKKQELQEASAVDDMNMVGRLGGGAVDRSLKAYYREFRKVVETSDVVLEVLDARDPLGCRCYQVEQAVMAAGTDKKLILVLNKIDLVPRSIVEAWLKHLRNEFPTVAFKASTQTQKQNLSQKKLDSSSEDMHTSACLGADMLVKLLGSYCKNADIKTNITVGVVGLPNVGKSSVINSLKRSKACTVGATPGLTKSLQEVQLDKHIKLLDSPGVVMAYEGADIATLILRNCVKVESLDDPISPVKAILRRCNRLQVLEYYCIPEYDDVQEFLSHLAKKMGKLKKGGIPDIEAAAKSVLRDWNIGRIKFYTHPPEEWSLPSHVSADIVKEWGKEFDLKTLVEEEKKELSGLSSAEEGTAMVMKSSHPLMEAFQGAEFDEEGEELEEDMESELSDEESEEEEKEEMEGEIPSRQGQELMTVILPGRKQQREQAKKPGRKSKLKVDRDGDTEMTERSDMYNFDEYF